MKANVEDMFVTAVRYETKRMMQQRRVPEANILLHRSDDFLRNEMLLCVEILCNGLEDKKEFRTTSEGRVPISLSGFLKVGLHRSLARHRFTRWVLFVFDARLMKALTKYPSCPVVTNNHETWNVCPHGEHRVDCDRYLHFGSDFPAFNEEAKRRANEIVHAAVQLANASGMQERMGAEYRLERAAMIYNKVRGV